MHTGDRVWRLPLWDYYTAAISTSAKVDCKNIGKARGGRPCKAAALLREFVPCGQWMHIDATNVMRSTGKEFEYLRKGMAGRPTRTVVEFIAQTLCKETPKGTNGGSFMVWGGEVILRQPKVFMQDNVRPHTGRIVRD
uniref:Cytosol aminopeptidase domain-containing protein n=1 Tax=Megaselia scalaris TaxID=36166 RepID=T1GHS9_MEGSC